MLIGLDAIPLTEAKAGVGHYTFELARALALAAPSDEFELAYPARYPPVQLAGEGEPPLPHNLRTARVAVGLLSRHWWSIGLPRYIRRRRLELFHGTNYDVPLWNACPTVLTIHDLAYFAHPATHIARRVRRARRRLPHMTRTADMIITPSESVRREVCERLGALPAQVVAIPEAARRVFSPLAPADTAETRRRLGIGDDFILAVGTIEPRKNLSTLLRAFEELTREEDARGGAARAATSKLQLVIAGNRGWLTDEFFASVAASSVRERVRFTGYVADADLRALYSSCAVFVYPSIYEGFGLPLVEAMACGAPVVASRIPSLVETAGRDAARFFSPDDPHELARSILQLLDDAAARLELSRAGQRRASAFTWERTAQLTLEVYAEARRRRTRAAAG